MECTVNRTRDIWHNQLSLTGHDTRLSDLDRMADLGLRTVRYPILWEVVAGGAASEPQWEWAAQRLGRLRDLGIRPIVGLVHHGSGPASTHLLDEGFAAGLADFAAEVARRFPWIDAYTPVNEPLTTARFSGLYGHWYPHRRDAASFVRALLNQCRATVLAMQAIRRFCPHAELVQTEDLGSTHSSPHMRYQRDFDNARRWLTWDLLCGHVTGSHGLHDYLRQYGATVHELDAFGERPCPPQVIGINHYVTSDRYLDERMQPYPESSHGGNARESYADVDAVRVLPGAYRGWQVINEAWERYRIPIALTEVHLGCTREDQLRWFEAAWSAATAARRLGCHIRAVTSWSLFGSYNWDSLLTNTMGGYESGAFDVRTSPPRITAMGRLLLNKCTGAPASHPAAAGLGWWERSDKVLYKTAGRGTRVESRSMRHAVMPVIMVCGADGQLGRAIVDACTHRQLRVASFNRQQLDICDSAAVAETLERIRPWAVVNAAGFSNIDGAERHPRRSLEENARGPLILAGAAHRRSIPFLTYSSDMVFGGDAVTPYLESSATRPLNEYGRCQRAAEMELLHQPRSLCIRTARLFGSARASDGLESALGSLAVEDTVDAIDDVIGSATYIPDLVQASLDLLIDDAAGIYHLTNGGALSWAALIRRAAFHSGIASARLRSINAADMRLAAPLPRWSVMASERVGMMPGLDSALERYARRRASTRIDDVLEPGGAPRPPDLDYAVRD